MEEKEYNKKYFVVFDKKRTRTWWNMFLDKDICHCFIIVPGHGGCIEIQPSDGGTRIYCYKEPSGKIANGYLQQGLLVVPCLVRDTETPRIKVFRTCVSFIKDVIGVKNIFVITAKQLHKELTCPFSSVEAVANHKQ